jgi:hypothetical protein
MLQSYWGPITGPVTATGTGKWKAAVVVVFQWEELKSTAMMIPGNSPEAVRAIVDSKWDLILSDTTSTRTTTDSKKKKSVICSHG